MKVVNAVQYFQYEQEGTSNKYKWLWKGIYTSSVITALRMQIAVDTWGEDVKTSGKLSLTLAHYSKVQVWDRQDPTCTNSWRLLCSKLMWQTVLHRGLILPGSTISLETYDFKQFPQISATIKAYSSGWLLPTATALHLALRLSACRCQREKMMQKTLHRKDEGLGNS